MKESFSEKSAPAVSSDSPGRKQQMHALTSLRFFAAACIVFHHLKGNLGVPANAYSGLNLGSTVSFFFVLSGFVLAYAHPSLGSGKEVLAFLIRRWFRIWPLHVACLILFIVLHPHPFLLGLHTLQGCLVFLGNALLVHAWIPVSYFFFSFNGVSWTISAEWLFYLCFPLLLHIINRKGALWGLVFALIPLGLMLAVSANLPLRGYSGQSNEVTVFGLIHIGPLSRLFEFAVGMVMQKMTSRRDTRRIRPCMWLLQIIGISLAVWYIASQYKILPHPMKPNVFTFWQSHSGGIFIWAFVIWCFSFSNGWPSRLLSNRILVFLGEISYAIYLLHYPIAHIVAYHFGIYLHLGHHARLGLYFALVLVISSALYYLIEVPGRRLGKILAERMRKIGAAKMVPS